MKHFLSVFVKEKSISLQGSSVSHHLTVTHTLLLSAAAESSKCVAAVKINTSHVY